MKTLLKLCLGMLCSAVTLAQNPLPAGSSIELASVPIVATPILDGYFQDAVTSSTGRFIAFSSDNTLTNNDSAPNVAKIWLQDAVTKQARVIQPTNSIGASERVNTIETTLGASSV